MVIQAELARDYSSATQIDVLVAHFPIYETAKQCHFAEKKLMKSYC